MATITANGSKGHHKFTLEVTESSYSVENNTSDVTYTLKISPIQSGWDWNASGVSYKININGTQVASGPIYTYNGSSTVTIKSGTATGIAHNNDGTKTIDIGFTITDTTGYNYTPGNASKTGTLTLTTIPRASQITVTDANIGSSTNITINKASNDFKTTLWYKASGQNSWTKIVDKTSNQVYGWTVPTSFYALIPNAKTITCQFYADTYSGSTLVGTSSTVTATFTATGNPVISSFTVVDVNATTTALTGDSSKMIRYASDVKATVSSSGQNSATIVSNKVNGSSTSGGIVTFNSCSTNSFQLVVTDSRGYQSTQTRTMTMVDYVPLTITQTIARNQPTDNKVNINVSGNYFNGSFGSQSNTLTVQYRYKERSESWEGKTWTTLTTTLSGNTYSGSTQISNIDYTKIYDFEIKAADRIKTNTITGITVSKGTPVFNWDDDEFNINANSNIIGSVVLGSVKAKNLINYLVYDAIGQWGMSYILTDNKKIEVNTEGKAWAWVRYFLYDVSVGTPLTFSCNYTASGNAPTGVTIYDNNGNELTRSTTTTATSGSIKLTFTTTTSTIKLSFSANSSGSTITNTVTFTDLMLEEGDETTAYYEGKKYGYISGKTTNGNYIKYDDGTLIQWNKIEVNNQAINSAYGSLYQGTRYLTFPIPFVGDIPSCQCTEFQWGTGASWGTIADVTLTNITCRGIDITSRATGTKCRIGWFAIGRWK